MRYRKDLLPADVLERIQTTARRLDRVYCGGFGNDTAAIESELLLEALRAQADYREGVCR